MRPNPRLWLAAFSLGASVIACNGALAAQRAFVSTSGADNISCSLAAPCRTFAAAQTAVAAGGEIVPLDSGGYGAVTITKALTIDVPPGVYAGITVASGGDGVTVNAASSDRVVLRGLAINGQGQAGTNGIHVLTVGVVHVERCTVGGLTKGIFFEPSGAAKLVVADSIVRNNSSYGILGNPPAGGVASHVEVTRSEVSHNGQDGIITVDVQRASVTETFSTNNNGAGIWFATTGLSPSDAHIAVDRAQLIGNLAGIVTAGSPGALATATLTRSVISNTAGIGVLANLNSVIELSDNQIAGNNQGTGVFGMPVGVIESAGNNIRVRNTTPGDPAGAITLY